MRTYEYHHLTPGQRQYLARKGIRGREFDKMSPLEQNEWVQEMKDGHYAKNDRTQRTVNAVPNY